jgi:hypothetical protein
MEWCSVNTDDASVIGARARMIRRRRGLSLDVVAGLAGISGAYLSMLETGRRGFNRRGLLDDLAKCRVGNGNHHRASPERGIRTHGSATTTSTGGLLGRLSTRRWCGRDRRRRGLRVRLAQKGSLLPSGQRSIVD